jgi:hypothetical protein
MSTSVDPVGAIDGADVGLVAVGLALPLAFTVTVCWQLAELLTAFRSSVKIADAWNVPGLLYV